MQKYSRTGSPLIGEVRRVKREISAEFDHDPEKLVAYLTGYQKQFADRFAASPPVSNTGDPRADPALVSPLLSHRRSVVVV